LAKGDSKLYFYKEVVGTSIILGCNVMGYYFWGLEGLGISFVIGQALVFIYVYAIVRIKYNFTFNKAFYQIFSVQSVLCVIAFLFAYYLEFPWAYLTGGILFLITGWVSFKEMDKRMDIKQIIRSKILKK
jgi:O-antigen/teichoic acid export membrane protein